MGDNRVMENLITVILGGGKGTRLYPLTKSRSKPAVPLAGKYRLIDIPISNCINSGNDRMFILSQFQSASLNTHITDAYRFDQFSRAFVQVIAAELSGSASSGWFQGTADAVRQTLPHIRAVPSQHTLVLGGDHLYAMDYRQFYQVHYTKNADITIAVQPVAREHASEFGLLKVDDTGRIIRFKEKPKTAEELAEMEVDTSLFGLNREEAVRRPFLASMGIYLFRNGPLDDMLRQPVPEPDVSGISPDEIKTMLKRHDLYHHDFGGGIIPRMMQSGRNVYAYVFRNYWADIGTVSAFFEANMMLISPLPALNIFDPAWPIYTHSRFLPAAKVTQANIDCAMLCEGVIIDDGVRIKNSILGIRSRVRHGADIEDCFIMGADSYQPDDRMLTKKPPRFGINENAVLRRAIIDKDASIGPNVRLINHQHLREYDDPEGRFYVRDGIIVVPKKAVLLDIDF